MDDDAFEAFWHAHYQGVSRLASGIAGNSQDGMEIAQEAFARAFQRWRKVSRMDRPDAWVYKVATNLAISTRRRSRHVPALSAEGVIEPADPPDDELLAALRTLSPSQRAAVCLRYYLDWSVEDVAQALGTQPGTVRALTHQGMQRLRAVLTKEPYDE